LDALTCIKQLQDQFPDGNITTPAVDKNCNRVATGGLEFDYLRRKSIRHLLVDATLDVNGP
jgi:hypothetical protein